MFLNPLFLILSPILVPVRLFIVLSQLLVLFVFHSFLCLFVLKNDGPLPAVIYRWFSCSNQIIFKLICLACSCRVETTGQVQEKILICNHSTLFDFCVLFASGVNCILSKASVQRIWILRPTLYLSKCLYARNHSNAIDQLKKRYGVSNSKYPPICIFCTGTTIENDCLIKFRSGAFQPLKPVQMVNIQYNLGYDYTFTIQQPFAVVFNILKNPVGCARVDFMETIAPDDDEKVDSFRERSQIIYGFRTGREILPFDYKDMLWFTDSTYQTSQIYKEEFGWMGSYKNYKSMCKKYGLDPYQQWSQEQLHLE